MGMLWEEKMGHGPTRRGHLGFCPIWEIHFQFKPSQRVTTGNNHTFFAVGTNSFRKSPTHLRINSDKLAAGTS